ncbi:hypothetical protein [Microcystis aeruginosa]|uniref:hypothetical protein n=1 Tax=Microcystis aeruginosa TaxID=1126 RepID=UPI00232E9247|nr:hypothetical protein [Microcystis aeruginosa]MDB9416651.1 hypothetical protein [Microcystis aeruginosa CS-556/03]
MLKSDWIKLINAIRLRKKEYNGTDGDIHYSFYYKKICTNRGYGEGGDMVDLSYDQCSLGFGYKGNSLGLTSVYGHTVCCFRPKYDSYVLEKIQKYHSREEFIPHICPGHPTTASGCSFSNDNDFLYYAGFYIAAFLYAFDVKDTKLQLIDKEWIVFDSKLGYFDFATYFSNHQVIPIKLPIPKFLDPNHTSVLKLAEGLEINDQYNTNYQQASQYLDEIRREIKDGLLDQ